MDLLRLDGRALVFGRLNNGASRLWLTDGSQAGSRVLRELPLAEGARLFRHTSGEPVTFFLLKKAFGNDVLARTDGTEAGTYELTHASDGDFVDATRVGYNPRTRTFFFSLTRADLGREPWVSDGTLAGTRRLADLFPGRVDGSPTAFVPLHDRMIFAGSGPGQYGLWVTDGTPEGTRSIGPAIQASSGAWNQPVSLGDRVIFKADDDFNRSSSVWVTDGTSAGTRLLHTLADVDAADGLIRTPAGVLYAERDSQGRSHLWRTDGTAGGTRRLATFRDGASLMRVAGPLSRIDGWVRAGGRFAYFLADDGLSGMEAWVTDGTARGTRLLVDACPGACSSNPIWSSVPRDWPILQPPRPFFWADDGRHGQELWFVNDSTASARRITDLCPGPCDSGLGEPRPMNGAWYLVENRRLPGNNSFRYALWQSEDLSQWRELASTEFTGTTSRPGLSIGKAIPTRDGVVFPWFSEERDHDIWFTDGTRRGTRMEGALDSGTPGSDPSETLAVGEDLYFVANDGLSGDQVWFRDAATQALRRISDFEETRVDPRTQISLIGPSKGGLLFVMTPFNERAQLWVAGENPGEIQEVVERSTLFGSFSPSGAARLDDDRFLLVIGGELWVSDGTPPGTSKIWDGSVIEPFAGTLFGLGDGRFLFLGREGLARVNSLYVSDGTSTGTRRIEPASLGEPRELLAEGDGTVLIRASSAVDGSVLWVSDGSDAGTGFVVDPRPDGISVNIEAAWWVGGRFLAYTATGRDQPRAIWETDGTTSGTRRLALPTLEGLRPAGFHENAPLAGGIVFSARSVGGTDGNEAWFTDGTEVGTFRLADINPGFESSEPSFLASVDGRLYLTASNGTYGRELWTTDGTPEGTELVFDLNPGGSSASPSVWVATSNWIYFTAEVGDLGRELWRMPRQGAGGPCVENGENLCLHDGRVRVRVLWKNQHDGGSEGVGRAERFSKESGTFWFFSPSNVELVVKVLDATSFSDFYWTFYGGLTDVEFWLEVSDLETGESRLYYNRPGDICGGVDLRSLPGERRQRSLAVESFTPPAALESPTLQSRMGSCVPDADTLCLREGRFAVEVDWHVPRTGERGKGTTILGTDESGYFWFFDEGNLELVVKILDGRPLTGAFWVFYGALSTVEYQVRVTDTLTQETRFYNNTDGNICGVADTAAFPAP